MPYVYTNPHKASLFAAQIELQQRRAELIFVTQRIAQLEESIRVLEPLANDEGVAPTAGLPEICREILMSQPCAGFTAEVVMQHLSARGVDISKYSNPLALLHTTLTRLIKNGSGFYKLKQMGSAPAYFYDPNAVSGVYQWRVGPRGQEIVRVDE